MKIQVLSSVTFLSLIVPNLFRPVAIKEISNVALKYLKNYGYYSLDATIEDSLKRFQNFGGLVETGILDRRTTGLMRKTRCGVPDILNKANRIRSTRYVLHSSKWTNRTLLTWRLQNQNNDGLLRWEVEDAIQKAFSKWEAVANLTFTKVHHQLNGSVDIEISFQEKFHNDDYPFDGSDGSLAHAFFPTDDNTALAGDIHFDDDERFKLNNRDKGGRNLYMIALHEIGHSLGLEHSPIKASVMFPWYPDETPDEFYLHTDDIKGIQALYGSQAVSSKNQETIEATGTAACAKEFKAVVLDRTSSQTYIINNDTVYILNRMLNLVKGPQKLNTIFPGLQSIDSAYRRRDGKLVFFKGMKYYIYSGITSKRKLEEGSIFTKFRGLAGNVQKIDAAFVWSGNGQTYLFTGDRYYRYNEPLGHMDLFYPRLIEYSWIGVPDNVEAVFDWLNGMTYFFKGPVYYRFNKRKLRVDEEYPKSIAKLWTKCDDNFLKEMNGTRLLDV